MSAAPRTVRRLDTLRDRARVEARNIVCLMAAVGAASEPDSVFNDDVFTAHVELFISHINAIDRINEKTK